MTPEQIMLIQISWAEIAPLTDKLGGVFYGKLFEIEPRTRELFSTDMLAQGETLISMLGVAVNMLDKLSLIDPIVQDLGRRHSRYQVRPEFIAPFREALIYTLNWALGAGFNAQVKEAWEALYDVLVNKMGFVDHSSQA
jgi:hemoglobin-like flavoprotein